MSPLLRIRNLKITVAKKKILQNICLDVASEEIVGLLGPNGSGKSTVFQAIMGVIPIDEGEIALEQTPITHLPIHKKAQAGIGYLAQEPSIFQDLTVENNILAILELLSYNREKRLEVLDFFLDELSLQRVRKKLAKNLSGGEKRRLEIARTLARNPRIVLLDEPFANIDPLSIEDLQHLLKHLRKKGLGILITDHNARELFSLVDRLYLLFEGKVLFTGKPEELVENPMVRSCYLGSTFHL